MEDFENYLAVKSEPCAVKWSGFATAPDRAKLYSHFENLIGNRSAYVYFLAEDPTNEIAGYAQLNRQSKEVVEFAGYSLMHKFHNLGINRKLSAMIVDEAATLGFKKIVGWISENNYASIRWNSSFGMQRTEISKVVRLEAFDRHDVYHLYEKVL